MAVEWTEFGRPWMEFWALNLADPGVEVMVGGRAYLIGDINGQGGICDDCLAFSKGEIVTRYRRALMRL